MQEMLKRINVCRFCGSQWCAHNDGMTVPLSNVIIAARRVGMNLQVQITPKPEIHEVVSKQ